MTIRDYVDKGVYQNKIIEVFSPSVIWNTRLRRIMNNEMDIVSDGDSFKITIENNYHVNMKSYRDIDLELVDRINNSPNGIAIYDNSDNYRFEFLPI